MLQDFFCPDEETLLYRLSIYLTIILIIFPAYLTLN